MARRRPFGVSTHLVHGQRLGREHLLLQRAHFARASGAPPGERLPLDLHAGLPEGRRVRLELVEPGPSVAALRKCEYAGPVLDTGERLLRPEAVTGSREPRKLRAIAERGCVRADTRERAGPVRQREGRRIIDRLPGEAHQIRHGATPTGNITQPGNRTMPIDSSKAW